MNWDVVAAEFEWDGSLRDLCVLDTTVEDWTRLLRALPGWPYPWRYEVDGAAAALPSSARDAFAGPHAFLAIDVEGVRVACHFFSLEDLEFDIDPRDVKGAREFAALEAFIGRVGAAVGRAVRMTPENTPDLPFLVYTPHDDRLTCTPVGVWR